MPIGNGLAVEDVASPSASTGVAFELHSLSSQATLLSSPLPRPPSSASMRNTAISPIYTQHDAPSPGRSIAPSPRTTAPSTPQGRGLKRTSSSSQSSLATYNSDVPILRKKSLADELLKDVHRKHLKGSMWISHPRQDAQDEWNHEEDRATEWLSLFYGTSGWTTVSASRAVS